MKNGGFAIAMLVFGEYLINLQNPWNKQQDIFTKWPSFQSVCSIIPNPLDASTSIWKKQIAPESK